MAVVKEGYRPERHVPGVVSAPVSSVEIEVVNQWNRRGTSLSRSGAGDSTRRRGGGGRSEEREAARRLLQLSVKHKQGLWHNARDSSRREKDRRGVQELIEVYRLLTVGGGGRLLCTGGGSGELGSTN